MIKEIPESIRRAIETMKGDGAGSAERIKASELIDDWVAEGNYQDHYDRERVVHDEFDDIPGSGAMASPIKGTLVNGSSTAPITASAKGTGLRSQPKAPNDLRRKI